jgi:hypothetical protein
MELDFEHDAVVVVAGVPGAGRSTLIRRAVERTEAAAVDTCCRARTRRRSFAWGGRLPPPRLQWRTTQPLGTTGFDVVGSWGRLRVEVPEASLNPGKTISADKTVADSHYAPLAA